MNALYVGMIFVLMTACSSNVPTNSSSIKNNITVEYDSFKRQTWIETPLYLSRQGFTDTFPVNIKFRSLYRKGKNQFIQLYVAKMDINWGFYHSANGEDGYQFDFVKIDSDVDSSGGMVTTNEYFALAVPKTYLAKMSKKDWVIKVYGKRNEGTFIVPMSLSQGFLSKLKCYESKTCT